MKPSVPEKQTLLQEEEFQINTPPSMEVPPGTMLTFKGALPILMMLQWA